LIARKERGLVFILLYQGSSKNFSQVFDNIDRIEMDSKLEAWQRGAVAGVPRGEMLNGQQQSYQYAH
jgi:hypothetical protein